MFIVKYPIGVFYNELKIIIIHKKRRNAVSLNEAEAISSR